MSTGARTFLRISLTASYTSSQLLGGWISTCPAGSTTRLAGFRFTFLGVLSSLLSALRLALWGVMRVEDMLETVVDDGVSTQRFRFREGEILNGTSSMSKPAEDRDELSSFTFSDLTFKRSASPAEAS